MDPSTFKLYYIRLNASSEVPPTSENAELVPMETGNEDVNESVNVVHGRPKSSDVRDLSDN